MMPRMRLSRLPGARGFPLRCLQCEDAPCALACMAGAMRIDPETQVVQHDPEQCVGCWMCVMVCPFSALREGRDRKVAVKCDLCAGHEGPACVEACPTHALALVDGEREG
jgi:anaerobic carbon-monoxide dehydrogenase iron sulfur subunit